MLPVAGRIFPPSVIGDDKDRPGTLPDKLSHIPPEGRLITDGRRHPVPFRRNEAGGLVLLAQSAGGAPQVDDEGIEEFQIFPEGHLLHSRYQDGLVVDLVSPVSTGINGCIVYVVDQSIGCTTGSGRHLLPFPVNPEGRRPDYQSAPPAHARQLLQLPEGGIPQQVALVPVLLEDSFGTHDKIDSPDKVVLGDLNEFHQLLVDRAFSMAFGIGIDVGLDDEYGSEVFLFLIVVVADHRPDGGQRDHHQEQDAPGDFLPEGKPVDYHLQKAEQKDADQPHPETSTENTGIFIPLYQHDIITEAVSESEPRPFDIPVVVEKFKREPEDHVSQVSWCSPEGAPRQMRQPENQRHQESVHDDGEQCPRRGGMPDPPGGQPVPDQK